MTTVLLGTFLLLFVVVALYWIYYKQSTQIFLIPEYKIFSTLINMLQIFFDYQSFMYIIKKLYLMKELTLFSVSVQFNVSQLYKETLTVCM